VTYFCIWDSSRISGDAAVRESSARIVCRIFDAAFVKLLWHLVLILSATLLARSIAAEMLIVEWPVKCFPGILSLTSAATDVLWIRSGVKMHSSKNIMSTLPLSYPLARCNYSTTISSYILTVCDIVGRIRQSQ